MIPKHILVPDRVRRPPRDGWSWIDRRFLREHAPRLSHEAIVLYFFLAAVSDKDGLSFYGDATIALRLRMSETVVVRAREELLASDLVAYRAPLVQVLSLPQARVERRDGGLTSFGEILRTLTAPSPPPDFPEVIMKVSLWAEIRRLHEVERLSQAAIVRRLHCSHRTVRKALAASSPPASKPGRREGILDRYRPRIDALLAKYPHLNAVRVTQEISQGEDGYRGSVYAVRRYLRRVRPLRGRVYQEVIYEPGEAMQVDWGDYGRLVIGQTTRRVSVFVAVLCYSRLCYIEFSLSQRKADFYRGVTHALEFFQGSPRKLIVDNLKSAVLNGSGRYACFHQDFLALCGHFCLEPIACAARDPESKGIVEGGVRYVKSSALAGRSETLTTWEDYRRLAPWWRDEVANVRLHATTKQRPVRSLPAGTPPSASLAGAGLRHRRDRSLGRHVPCPRAV